ncbi:MAG: DJ-1/PfpI family protein, partial [Mariprofundaceae bacterium]|nr:DJ-1/PfpI family protein [Mariprofundaceae bacterium]
MKKVLVPFTEGVEEIEFIAIVDILRRADIHVTTASLDGQVV